MRYSPALAAAIVLFLVWTGGAEAHGSFAGAGGFYGGVIHPLVVPAELLALVSVGLLLGRGGRRAVAAGVPALGIGVSAGLLSAHFFAVLLAFQPTLPLIAATVVAALVVIEARTAPSLSMLIALAAGFAVGVDAVPEGERFLPLLMANLATVIACMAIVLVLAAIIIDRAAPWVGVAIRIMGSWIVACTILYLGWALSRP